ncbi:MAG: 3-(cis-5,6-dihydroxycyclohexa-1,3-dien-1-yl)propanoate dehydrogenase [Rhodospirillaceae bacterium]|nr:3-(cis-5,6-dihydroxycyclohexa-1,3-dien-1-yl)propanoate dehydrogenase [Rhodospirillaceae bacterium]|tara:strand:+ start:15366 stop:16151 length:786 start_codon:yes stop_codon:yes gene_type:complete
MQWLENKVIFITGAGEGIGKTLVSRFIEEGVVGIVAFDLIEDRLTALRDTYGDRVATVCGDVRNLDDNRKAVDLAISTYGRLDVFVGNAGVRDGRKRLEDMGEHELTTGFDDVFGINVKGYMIGTAAAREELAKNKGCVVLTLSTSSFYVGSGPIYTASKHAALGLMRALAHELAPDIRVNGVAPSGTPTSFADAESLLEPGADRTPARSGGPHTNILERQTEPEDHAAAYVLLASNQSAVMTGAVINTDAGRGITLASQR